MGERGSDQDFDAIVSAIYEAALDAGRWPAALTLINAELGAVACGLRYQSFATGAFWQTWHGLEEEFERAYVEHYFKLDPWVEKAHALREGQALHAETALPLKELQQTVFFNELCKPFQMQDLVGGILVRTEDELVSFGAMRRSNAPTFEERDARVLERLLPHLRRAYEVQRRIDEARRAERASWTAIESLRFAVLLLDRSRRVVRTNGAADSLLSSQAGLFVEDGELRARTPTAAAALLRLLSRAGGAPIEIEREGRRALLASTVPLDVETSTFDQATGGLMVLVVDPDGEPTTPTTVLERLFGLTRAEARIALLVGSGRAPKEVAQLTGRTWNTVRDQLKQVYAKTGTSGQTTLVRLVSGISLLPPGR